MPWLLKKWLAKWVKTFFLRFSWKFPYTVIFLNKCPGNLFKNLIFKGTFIRVEHLFTNKDNKTSDWKNYKPTKLQIYTKLQNYESSPWWDSFLHWHPLHQRDKWMDLWHLFCQLKLIAFVFQLRNAVLFLNNGQKVILHTVIRKVQITTLQWFYVFIGQLRPGIKYPFNYSFPRRELNISTFSKLMDTFTKLLIIQLGHPCFKWFVPTHIRCLNIFCAPTWNNIYIHLFQIFSHAVSHMTFIRIPS